MTSVTKTLRPWRQRVFVLGLVSASLTLGLLSPVILATASPAPSESATNTSPAEKTVDATAAPVSDQPSRAPSAADAAVLVERLETVLPAYAPHFIDSAEEYGHDWRLLAAIGYQESKWDAEAVSPTGVRGLMMLTQATARQVEIEDRRDPVQSILGAARYLTWLDKQLPKSIHAEDRLWFTLAAYNVGMGHLLDARVLTERNHHDPNRWADVRKHLPLLSKEEWYSTVRHGYARGNEPVGFVDKVRHYKQLISQHVDEELLTQIIASQASENLPG